MTHRDDDGELFDLPTFFQRIFDLPKPPKPLDPDEINESYNEYSPTDTSEDSSTNPDDDVDNKEGINQDIHETISDHFVKDLMEQSTSRNPLNTESGDIGEDLFSSFVQKPLCGNDNVRKFETLTVEDDGESRIFYAPSLGLEIGTSIPSGDPFLGSDLMTENIGYKCKIIDSSDLSSFSEELKSRVSHDYSLGLKSEASIEDVLLGSNLTTEKLGYKPESIDSFYQPPYSEVIKAGKSIIATDPSLGLKSEARIEDAFLGSNLTTENLGCNYESIESFYQSSISEAMKECKPRIAIDSSLGPKTEASLGETLFGNYQNTEVRKAIRENKFSIDNGPSLGLKSQVCVEEILLGNNRTTEYPEKVQNGVKEDKSRIYNDPSLRLKTSISVEENIFEYDQNAENPEKIRKVIPKGSSFEENINNRPSRAEKYEYTNYYLTPYATMMRVIENGGRLDEDQILRCKIDGFTCNFCGDKFRSRENLREHKRGYVNSFIPSLAHICSRYSQRYCIVLGYNNQGQVQFKCSHCQKRFKCFGNYARHCNNQQICKRHQSYLVSPFVLYCELDSEEMGFECLLCQESSTVYAEMKFHECVISRHPPDDDDGDDDDCDNDDDGDVDVEDDDDDSFKCNICDVEFSDHQSYEDHRTEHALGKKLECKTCFQTFKRSCSFKTHVEDSHKGKTRVKKDRTAKRKP